MSGRRQQDESLSKVSDTRLKQWLLEEAKEAQVPGHNGEFDPLELLDVLGVLAEMFRRVERHTDLSELVEAWTKSQMERGRPEWPDFDIIVQHLARSSDRRDQLEMLHILLAGRPCRERF